nr:hypothetical protein [Tanacetum cinerariifolium]
MTGYGILWDVSISVPTAKVYTAEKFTTVEDFALLHEDKIYSELKMRYLQHKHYALWEVIEFGDSYKAPPKETAKDKGLAGEVSSSTKKKGRTVAITAEDMQKRKNDTKKNQLKQQYGNFKAEGSEILEQTFNRLQAIVSHLEFMDVPIEQDDLNQKFLTSLAPEWLVYTIVWRNRDDLDTMSLDDVYNHLKVYEPEVQKRAGSNSQNMAFISLSNNNSGKSKVPTIKGASTATTQLNGSQIKYEDISQIDDDDDIEEMDIKWNLDLLSIRADRFWKKTGKKITIQGFDITKESRQREERELQEDPKVEEPALMEMITIDEEVPTEYALMAKSSSSSDNEEVKKEKESIEFKIEKIENASKDLDRRLGSQKLDKDMKGMRFNEYCAVLPPPAQVYSPPKKDLSWMGLPEFVDDTVTDYTRPTPSIDVSKSVTPHSNVKRPFERKSAAKNKVSSPTVRPKIPTIGLKVPTAKPTVAADNRNKGKAVKASAHWIWKPKQNSSDKGSNFNGVSVTFKKYQYIDTQGMLKSDSGCSRHMTGNIFDLFEFEPFNGGYVSFGHGRGKITGKGSIKTGKLEFENVYFVEELKYNLSNLVKGLPSKSFENTHSYVACLKGKQHKASFVTDDFSMFSWTFFLKSKDETSRILRNFITEIENLKDLNVKIIRSDNGGEFRNKEMDEFYSRKGIKKEFSNARTPQQNGVVERRNKTLIEAAKTMVLVIKPHNKTPYKLFNERSLAIGFLRPFGCHVMILNTLDHLGKFDAKGDEGYFVGYSLSSKAFRVFNKRTKKIYENLHVDLLENKSIEKGTGPDWLFDIDTLTNSINYVPVVVVGTSSTNISGTKEDVHQAVKESPLRFIALPNWFHEAQMATSNKAAKKDDAIQTIMIHKRSKKSSTVETKVPTVSAPVLTDSLSVPPVTSSVPRIISKRGSRFPEPLSLGNAMSFENKLKDFFGDTSNAVSLNEVKADLSNMETAIQVSPTPTLRIHKEHPKRQIIGPVDTPVQTRQKTRNNVWVLVDCPSEVRPIGMKWVLKNKKDKKGIAIRNKARLVAQGHTQEEEIDYEEVFAPVAKIEAIRLFLAYASYMGFTVYQMDVKSAFMYGTIDEEVYVMQSPRFQDHEFPHRVYKVEKAVYGLHQALRAWYGTLSKYLLDNGFQKGLQVLQMKDGIFLSQDKYVGDILKKFRHTDIRAAKTPMDRENLWGKDVTRKDMELHLYRSMIGSLMYLTTSRPYIMFTVCACARHQVTPKECHLHAVKRIFRYLKGNSKLGLWYPKESPFDLVAYSDSDYGGANQDRKSTTRGCQFLGKRLISLQCKKHTIMATSTTEAEYVAAASGCGQVLWIQNQLLDYGYNFMNTKIYIDNNSVICIVKNPVYHSKTKHIEIRHHFIRDCYEKKLINVDHIHTDDNVADLLTKAFDVGRFQYLVVSIGMLNP